MPSGARHGSIALEDGVVFHTYSTYEGGVDASPGMHGWLDGALLARNATGIRWRRHDKYDS